MQGEAMIYVWLVQKYCILNSLHDGPSRIDTNKHPQVVSATKLAI
jgi:hypothetical protein